MLSTFEITSLNFEPHLCNLILFVEWTFSIKLFSYYSLKIWRDAEKSFIFRWKYADDLHNWRRVTNLILNFIFHLILTTIVSVDFLVYVLPSSWKLNLDWKITLFTKEMTMLEERGMLTPILAVLVMCQVIFTVFRLNWIPVGKHLFAFCRIERYYFFPPKTGRKTILLNLKSSTTWRK